MKAGMLGVLDVFEPKKRYMKSKIAKDLVSEKES